MARALMMVERLVSAAEREAYLRDLAKRGSAAKHVRLHFWVFEHADESGRFVEFTEGASEVAIASAHTDALPAPLWREVYGG